MFCYVVVSSLYKTSNLSLIPTDLVPLWYVMSSVQRVVVGFVSEEFNSIKMYGNVSCQNTYCVWFQENILNRVVTSCREGYYRG